MNTNFDMEVWKPIPNYENLYHISNLGRIKALAKQTKIWNGLKSWPEKILSPILQKSGYLHIGLWKNGICEQKRVHRLVAEAFVSNDDPINKTHVNHLNEDKTDNRSCNLAWATPKENTNYGTCLQRRALSRGSSVNQYSLNGELISTFLTQAEANAFLGKNRNDGHISACCNGKQKTAYGYCWKFAN